MISYLRKQRKNYNSVDIINNALGRKSKDIIPTIKEDESVL